MHIAGVDSKVLSVIARLNRQSNRERSGRVKVVPDQEMLAITADTGISFQYFSRQSRQGVY